ncbi:GNAT family N-acetyltransferase [Aerococcaceae bacterium NML210727]|nr:GNAT family N-acetyltransferase [Aerococcaceae bacterium NML210727]MCW6654479.1 GNAT family N-acetyltransferase [Aerococcaceae bacterium NML201296]MCW6661992.1 GNAT family N-acetyltransferase [Aerococcaceae bacterium NML201209]MCW6675991.1 GNAT family N-acetyltransferase [Aerococcaceae bacterium NML180378]
MLTYEWNRTLPPEQVLELYKSVQWSVYTDNPEVLMKAMTQSLAILSAWENERLVGLIRVVGDNATILYIQDILVHPDYQRRGIGTYLMHETLRRYAPIRQKVLATDNTAKTRQFYESCGFLSNEQLNCICYFRDEYHMPPLEL